MKAIIISLFLLTNLLTSRAQGLVKFMDDSGKIGFKSADGKVVIKPKYTITWDKFTEGLIGVRIDKKWGYIDSTGKLVVPFKYMEVSEFLPGVKLARVYINSDKMGYINNAGKEVIPAIYDELGEQFYDNVVSAGLNNKYGAIDNMGKIVIPFVYNSYLRFSYGGLVVVSLNKKKGVIGRRNEKIIPFLNDDITMDYNAETKEVIFIVKRDNRYGVINKANGEIIPFLYDKIEVTGNLFSVKLTGVERYGLYNKSGKQISEGNIYSLARHIGNNVYACSLRGGPMQYIDEKGNKVDRKGNKIEE